MTADEKAVAQIGTHSSLPETVSAHDAVSHGAYQHFKTHIGFDKTRRFFISLFDNQLRAVGGNAETAHVENAVTAHRLPHMPTTHTPDKFTRFNFNL